MKTKNIVLIILLILGTIGGWMIINKLMMPRATQKVSPTDTYYCPMHPDYQSDKPGSCPICHMKLVKKETHESADKELSEHSHASIPDHGIVKMDFDKQQLIGIKTTTVVRKPLVKTIRAPGVVVHDLELYEAQLEYIEAWQEHFAFSARRPIKDEFRSDWRDYYKAPATQHRWRSNDKLKVEQRLIKAEYELVHMGLTHTEIEQLREVKYGQPWIQPELLFFEENQPFWVYAQIYESDLGFIAPTQKAIIHIPNYGESTEGVVKSIVPVVDPETRTVRVRIAIPQYRSELSVNMLVNVEFPVELNTEIVVPRDAIMDTGLRKIVFVKSGDGIFEPRDVKTGLEGDGMIAIKSGVKEGEVIVVAGNFLLDSESRLQAALNGGHRHD